MNPMEKETTKPPISELAIMGLGLGIIGISVGVANRADKGIGNEFEALGESDEVVDQAFACAIDTVRVEGNGQGNDNQDQCDE
jgi:hypothetical protein